MDATPTPLTHLPVLLLDCQATGTSPSHGHLLEIAWVLVRATATDEPVPEHVQAHLVAQPEGAPIPPRITELTGISDADMDAASPAEVVRDALRDALAEAECVVIHYASFERPFLVQLLGDSEAEGLEILCTHALARRLMPDLPSRGIRGVAGYLGHPIERLKRSAEHIVATERIWSAFVGLLAERQITTLEGLRALLAEKAPKATGPKLFRLERERRLALPAKPGVYRMLAHGGRLLYVGKATSLKSRVNSYFQKRRGDSTKNREMLAQVWDLDVTPTATPLEAALLESDLIKAHDPPYNVALKAGGRVVRFASADLGAVAAAPDAAHPVGPLISLLPTRFLPALRDALGVEGSLDDGARLRLTDLPERWCPDAESFEGGFARFLELAGLHGPTPLSRLMRAGADAQRRWLLLRELERQRRQEGEDTPDSEDAGDTDALADGEPPTPDAGLVWTPELVAGHLDALLRAATLGLRRARWLALLADCTVLWLPRGRRTQHRLLVFEGGQLSDVRDVGLGEAPAPPGAGRARLARLQGLDLVTVDRLAVLSGELRQLVRLGRHVEVAFGARARVGRAELERLFLWL